MNYSDVNLMEVQEFYCPFDTYHQYATLEKGIDFLLSGALSVAYLNYDEAKGTAESMQIPDYDANVLCVKYDGNNYIINTMWYLSDDMIIDGETMRKYLDNFKVIDKKNHVKKMSL